MHVWSFEIGLLEHWSIWDVRSKEGLGAWTQLNWMRRRRKHLEDQLDHLLDQPVEFSTRPADIPLFYMLFIWFYYAFHKPAERTRPDRKGIGFARPSPGPIRPHDRTVRPGRQWTTIDRDHHITADPDGRPHALHGRPDVREQEAHLCSFDNSQPN
ncbi:unnamed protein product [Microthlaspi erraticum]|uniref:Uncharacterized protein n=1 Tax=Microthlaspi erraticum TaxID=1685480 RepID=A0A6D2IVD6_9BRAS|nr:unnamed protein product [Microthlaspi erraticum]